MPLKSNPSCAGPLRTETANVIHQRSDDFENHTSDRSAGIATLRHNRFCAGQSRHPRAEAACAPDAFRLCSSYIPDPTRVEHCLRQSKSDLSDACRSAFEQSAGPVASTSK
jgi:hypothetical protein